MIVPEIPLLLLPGLNGEERVFAEQVRAFPTASVVNWLPPERRESLDRYARRLADRFDPGRPCVVAGVSFGGILAMEVIRHFDAQACVLIASARHARNLPLAVRVGRPVARLIPAAALGPMIHGGYQSAAVTVPKVRARTRRLSAEAMAFRQWALQALLHWQPPGELSCPVFQVHGEFDTVFPLDRATTTDVIAGGHLISLTHPEEVNAVLRRALQIAAGEGAGAR